MITGFLKNETYSKDFAKLCAKSLTHIKLNKGFIIFLQGDLGSGKTFFCRSLIQSYLPAQKVKSPTYTLVESYTTDLGIIQHFDLYRVCDAEELEFLGIRDLLSDSFCTLIEWAEKGTGVLPKHPDIEITFKYNKKARNFIVKAFSEEGFKLVKVLAQKLGTKFDSNTVK